MLEVWAARTLTLGVPTDGCGVAVPCCWPSNTYPRSKRDMHCQGASGYTPGSGGLRLQGESGLHADPGPPNPGTARGVGGG